MIYRLRKAQIVELFVIPSVVTLGWVISVWWGAPFAVYILGFALSALAWYGYMKTPFEFEIGANDSMRFRSVACRLGNKEWGQIFRNKEWGQIFILGIKNGVKSLFLTIRGSPKKQLFKHICQMAKSRIKI